MASVMPNPSGDENLQARLDRNEPFTQAQLLTLLAALADELREAHRLGRFHGAITPADIRYDGSGRLTLGGWGRDTTPDAMQNSAYAAIERYVPVHPQGPWTDVYALAAILWRAIAGGPLAPVLQRKGDVTLERLAPSGYDLRFLRAVDAGLAVAPQRRPRDVDRWLVDLTTPTPPAPPSADGALPTRPGGSRPRAMHWPVAVLATAIVAAMGIAILPGPAVAPGSPPTDAPAIAPRELPAVPPRADLATPRPAASVPAPAIPVVAERPAAIPRATAAARPVPAAVRAAPRIDSPPEPARAASPPPPAPEPTPPPIAVESLAVAFDPPPALLKRTDDALRKLYADYDRLNGRIARSYRKASMPYATKEQVYRESRSIQAALAQARDDRNRIVDAESRAIADARSAALAEEMTRIRDRIEMVRRSL